MFNISLVGLFHGLILKRRPLTSIVGDPFTSSVTVTLITVENLFVYPEYYMLPFPDTKTERQEKVI